MSRESRSALNPSPAQRVNAIEPLQRLPRRRVPFVPLRRSGHLQLAAEGVSQHGGEQPHLVADLAARWQVAHREIGLELCEGPLLCAASVVERQDGGGVRGLGGQHGLVLVLPVVGGQDPRLIGGRAKAETAEDVGRGDDAGGRGPGVCRSAGDGKELPHAIGGSRSPWSMSDEVGVDEARERLVDLVPRHAQRAGHPVSAEEGGAMAIGCERQQRDHGDRAGSEFTKATVVQLEHARDCSRDLIDWYNNEHRHSSLGRRAAGRRHLSAPGTCLQGADRNSADVWHSRNFFWL